MKDMEEIYYQKLDINALKIIYVDSVNTSKVTPEAIKAFIINLFKTRKVPVQIS